MMIPDVPLPWTPERFTALLRESYGSAKAGRGRLARELGFTDREVRRWCTGERRMPPDALRRIAAHLGYAEPAPSFPPPTWFTEQGGYLRPGVLSPPLPGTKIDLALRYAGGSQGWVADGAVVIIYLPSGVILGLDLPEGRVRGAYQLQYAEGSLDPDVAASLWGELPAAR